MSITTFTRRLITPLGALTLLLAMAGCSTSPEMKNDHSMSAVPAAMGSMSSEKATLYERLGGYEAISAVVKAKLTLVLGPTGFGRYSQALAAAEVADGMAAFGLNQVGPVLGAEYPEQPGTFLGVVLTLRSVVTLLVLGAAMFVAPLLIQSTPPQSFAAMSSTRLMFSDQTLAASPKRVLLATSPKFQPSP